VKIEHTTDDRMAEAVETLAASFDRFTESIDRLVYMVEDLAKAVGLDTLDDE
jgi:HAMP domain-containing protein